VDYVVELYLYLFSFFSLEYILISYFCIMLPVTLNTDLCHFFVVCCFYLMAPEALVFGHISLPRMNHNHFKYIAKLYIRTQNFSLIIFGLCFTRHTFYGYILGIIPVREDMQAPKAHFSSLREGINTSKSSLRTSSHLSTLSSSYSQLSIK
jgi:hypothetical protein